MDKKIEEVLRQQGYRYLNMQQENTGVFYKYFQEGFHVVMTIGPGDGSIDVITHHALLVEKIKDLFYHPNGRLMDFPEGFPVYHVEVLTLVVGNDSEQMRKLCSNTDNIWAYQPTEGRLFIYEGQPGDFWGLKGAIEATAKKGINNKKDARPFKDNIKRIRNLPYITAGIAFINIAIYLILEIMGDTEDASFISSHGGMNPYFVLYYNEWWRILTACFIHFGAVHLLNNMVIFCCVGSRLERATGHLKFMVVYLVSGISGGLLSYAVMLQTGDYAVSAGASGAVFGTIGGLLWAVIYHRGCFEGLTTRGMIFMIVLSLYFGFSTIGVDNWSHIGGIVSGFLITAVLYHRKYQKC